MRLRTDKGFTIIELLIVVAIIGIIAVIAIPGLLRARMSGNEASAIGSLRAITSSQQAYQSTCGGGFFAKALTTLADPPVAGTTAFISPDLSTAAAGAILQKSGYELMMDGATDGADNTTAACNPAGAVGALTSAYYVTAGPAAPGQSGTRYFWTSLLGTIYQDTVPFADTEGNVPPVSGTALR